MFLNLSSCFQVGGFVRTSPSLLYQRYITITAVPALHRHHCCTSVTSPSLLYQRYITFSSCGVCCMCRRSQPSTGLLSINIFPVNRPSQAATMSSNFTNQVTVLYTSEHCVQYRVANQDKLRRSVPITNQ